MNDDSDNLLKRLSLNVGELEKKQVLLKRALSDFKKRGCASDLSAANKWIQSYSGIVHEEIPDFHEIVKAIKKLSDEIALKFEADLREAVIAEGWAWAGQWPKYYIEFVIQVIIDEKKNTITVGTDSLNSTDIKKVIISLKSQLPKLKPDKEMLAEFLTDLYTAFLKLSHAQKGSVPVWDLYKEVVIKRQPKKLWRDANATHFHSFREIEFRAYLTLLLKENMTVVSDHIMRLLPPISKADSIYIYQPIENRFCHVGRVDFVKSGGE
jgi:hypothetical protein